jgi:hypothetical protein
MKPLRLFVQVLVVTGVQTSTLLASPTMIRIGYSDCAACHISPQGGGMLTTYGKGIDEAQSLRARETRPIDTAARLLIYDVRFIAASQLVDSLATAQSVSASTFRLQLRSSVRVSEKNRMSYAFGLESPTLTSSTTGGTSAAPKGVVSKALWEYRAKEGLEFALGRDEMPSGIGLPDPQAFIRKGNDPGDTAYPTQVKMFWWNRHVQLTPYAFAPGGDESPSVRQHGAGMLGGVDVWKQRAILGMSVRSSTASTFTRRSAGAFARLGFGKWGILAEHDFTSRTASDSTAPMSQYLAGHTQVFFAAKEWLVTSLAAEDLVVDGSRRSHTYRLTPGVQLRFSDNLTVIFNARDTFTGATAGRTRTFSLQLAVKTVE